MRAPLVDTHCHLDFDRYQEDLEEVLERAAAAGVTRMITVGCAQKLDNVSSSVSLARRFPDRLSATVGVHPHDAAGASEALLAAVETQAAAPEVVAVGEAGLDHFYDHAPREVQAEIFRRQVAVARRVGKPLVVHTRDAPAQTLAILREEGARDVGGVIHCFSEDAAFAAAALDLGFVAGFSGLLTFPRGTEAIREAARCQPLDAILVETDAPYLAPAPHRGARNEPGYVAHTADFLADLRGMDREELRQASTENARRVFGIEP